MANHHEPRSSSPLKCCQSTSSISLTEDIVTDGSANNNRDFHGNKNLLQSKNGHEFPKRAPADVVFRDVHFNAWTWSMTRFRREHKQILHGVSGRFKSGELSTIMGPSGAGKTTLLNVLAGYITKGSSGSVCVNDVPRGHGVSFRKLTAYIPQEEELRLSLTAMEAMTFAVNLKLSFTVTQDYKMQQITEILELLGLENCHDTLTARLSGGQRKRLAIALELINNPPILFLDEPTTGLDSLSCSQCVSLLKRLAQEGRTVICTIHQPSALVFGMFDNLYALAQGQCIYQGPISGLVPHLSSVGLVCPSYHNPADFLMEVAIGEHDTDIKKLASICDSSQTSTSPKKVKGVSNGHLEVSSQNSMSGMPPSVLMQFFILLRRNFLTSRRDYMYLFNRLLAHILIGFLFGYLYQGVGRGANTVLGNYVYLYGSLLLLVYTGKMSVTLTFPLEMKILNREHFNRWFNLVPYLLSVIAIEIPFQILCAWSYITISYWLTDQPADFRIYFFVLFNTLCTLCAQAWGYFIGATLPIKLAVFIGPVLACLFSVFGFCIRYMDTPVLFRWMFHVSYYRAGFQGVVYSMYAMNRTKLECPEEALYCRYKDPNKFLQEMGIDHPDLVSNVSLIVVIGAIMHLLTFVSLWYKLNRR